MERRSEEIACRFAEPESINFHFREFNSRAEKFSSLLSFKHFHRYNKFLVFSIFNTLAVF
jgi:hypothetical protein